MSSDNRVFQIAIIISLIAHGLILSQNPNLNFFSPFKNEQPKLEIRYVKEPKETKTEVKEQPAKREPLLKIPSKIALKEKVPPPFADKDSIFKNDKTIAPKETLFTKPAFNKTDIIAIKKKISISPMEMDKTKVQLSPAYMGYQTAVREKIKHAAYQNYTGREMGMVTISFLISEDGQLKDWRFIEEKSSSSEYLRDVALRSLKDASPFPIFPKELDYSLTSFNLTIIFEIE